MMENIDFTNSQKKKKIHFEKKERIKRLENVSRSVCTECENEHGICFNRMSICKIILER